jgi:hypothetical protein
MPQIPEGDLIRPSELFLPANAGLDANMRAMKMSSRLFEKHRPDRGTFFESTDSFLFIWVDLKSKFSELQSFLTRL